ncbi:thiamine diphosphokinase [Clostridium sp. DJ247]|uniref:thiamine diphosphokinase n=1 Tax=Clostridium sp. DJ247 TaxID=2726188 RepID=UPI0016287AA4|nr:thiamine diphosphokinase [Clostridium sp. DJ247]MBC2578970.1 thiamine diphosphokinase [Clostridium sp. DJ247]
MKIVIVSGGNPPSYSLITEELEDCSFLICADSGGNCLYKYNIIPDYLMGDFDSISEEAMNFFLKQSKCSIENYPSDKDFTDTELVFNKALELGGKKIIFLGCTGTRIDHLMGNIGMLAKCLRQNIKGYIKDNNNCIEITNKPVKITGNYGATFSLQAYSNVVKNLTIKGAKYELLNYDLSLGDARTVSNQFLYEEVEITFDEGVILILYSKD